ncbi:DUF7269 family protein [Halomarina pelagica]|uniref:DUF7269 family protein n=1 Tax=Halomarina pelagica TaxID=2961599 RepID=UPI0020C43F79|nr:hypothetical protein [Halomarina sp. BND7]
MRALARLGALLALAGLVVAALPRFGAGLSPPDALLLAVGAVAVLAGVVGLRARRRTPETPPLPAPERRRSATVPGGSFDADLSSVTAFTTVGSMHDRDRVYDRLYATAVEVLTRYDGCTPEEARTRLAAGSWTDDPLAAAFFADEGRVGRPLRERLRAVVSSDPAFRRQARRAVAALDSRAAGGR